MKANRFLLSLAAFLAVCTAAMAQNDDYRPFLKEGKVWKCKVWMHHPTESRWITEYWNFFISGDSVVGDKTYKKMYREVEPSSESMGRTSFSDLWREADRKVYGLFAGFLHDGEEVLRYDFTLLPGESAYIWLDHTTTLISVDTLEAQGGRFRRYHVKLDDYEGDYWPDPDLVWVEGIGHPGGPGRVWGAEVNDGTVYTLLSVYEDGECIFTQDDFSAPAVHDATDGIGGKGQMRAVLPALPCHDLQGRRLSGKPATRGLYIRNGKKVLITK